MLNSYPDYAKAPPSYLAAVAEAFAAFSEPVQEKLAGITTGLRAKCKFLPTVSDVIEMGNDFAAAEAKAQDQIRRFSGRRAEPVVHSEYNPYPQLTKAFANEPALFKNTDYEGLHRACVLLVTRGYDAARASLIANGKSNA